MSWAGWVFTAYVLALIVLCAAVAMISQWQVDRVYRDCRRLDELEKHLASEVKIGFDLRGQVRIYDPWGEVVGVGGDLRAALDSLDTQILRGEEAD